MFGRTPLDVLGYVREFRVSTSSWDTFITWFIPTLLIFLPFLALPFAIVRKRGGRSS